MNSAGSRKRPYDSRQRQEQARQSQARVIEAARTLLLERGYAGTTMKEIAARAGVSVEGVYKAFGTKPALIKRVYDITLVGDDEPVPLSGRPEILAIAAEADPRRKLALYAGVARGLLERLGPLQAVLLAGARAGDPDLQAFVATTDRERLVGATYMASEIASTGALRPGLTVEQARDIVWALIAPELHHLLVGQRGWTLDDYERFLAASLGDALCGSPPA